MYRSKLPSAQVSAPAASNIVRKPANLGMIDDWREKWGKSFKIFAFNADTKPICQI
jgi:hypothetical protein